MAVTIRLARLAIGLFGVAFAISMLGAIAGQLVRAVL